MIKKIYLTQKEEIDKILKEVEKSMPKIDEKIYKENKEIIEKIDDIYNKKINAICEVMYEKGFKDGMNLIIDAKKENKQEKN